MASGYLTMLRLTGDTQYEAKATQSLEWLMENKSPKFPQYTWANHFDFAGRGGEYRKDESIIVWTSLIGQAFLDAYDLLADSKYLKVAESACEWILALPREQTQSGICLSYHMLHQSSVHNANMLGAAMLARTAAITKHAEALRVAKQAMEYSCTRQSPDGSWFYGEEQKYHWIDSFHTGYNLDSLKCYVDHTEDRSFEGHLRRGLRYFKENFFEATGRPKYYHNRVYPVDIQCASQGIETLAKFSVYDASSRELGLRVARWTIRNMQSGDGHFYYRKLPWIKVRTPMLHWGQATMYKALTSLLAAVSSSENSARGRVEDTANVR
jgi:hypothetical protein